MSFRFRRGSNTEAWTHFDFFDDGSSGSSLHFQDGTARDHGINGVTNEDVIKALVIRITSLQEMQGGKFSCKENAVAITHLETALAWLCLRTQRREERGVEGTDEP